MSRDGHVTSLTKDEKYDGANDHDETLQSVRVDHCRQAA